MTTIKPVQILGTREPRQIKPIPESFTPEKVGWEFEYAAKHPTAYPLLRTTADLLPFGQFAFPSGRNAFAEAGLGGKALTLGLDALVLLPAGVVGKGLKLTARPFLAPLRVGAGKLPFKIKALADQSPDTITGLMRKVDKFEYKSARKGLVSKYGITDTAELDAVMSGSTFPWVSGGRSGAKIPSTTRSKEMADLFTQKGNLRGSIIDDLKRWAKPKRIQRLNHYKNGYQAFVSKILGTNYKLADVFKMQTTRLFGPKTANKLTFENIGGKDFSQIMMDALLNEGKLIRGLDTKSAHYLYPIRKVMMKFDPLYGTMDNVYNKVKTMFGAKNELANLYKEKFHAVLTSKGLGAISKKGVFTKGFSNQEWKRAGELVIELDTATAKGAATAELQKILDQGVGKTGAIVKAWQEFTDFLYNDFMKTRIPTLFEKAGLNRYGRIQLDKLFSSRGNKANMGSIFTEILAPGTNARYEDKARIITNVITRIRKLAKENPNWFKGHDLNPEEFLKSKGYRNLLKELEFSTPNSKTGLPDYLKNYATRIFVDRDAKYVPRLAKRPQESRAAFTKARSLEEAEGVSTDLGKIATARITMQAKELHVNHEYGSVLEYAKDLPPGLKNYLGHYIDRMLGRGSPIDQRIADVINASGFAGSKVAGKLGLGGAWDAQRVTRLSYGINDLIYMGGIGFKPFSAMRNYFQVPLNVAADLGGVKNVYWWARGYSSAAKKSTREYIRNIGAITQYAPDMLFKPVLPGFGKAIKLGSFEFNLPTKQKVRDMAMWLFKGSDQHNRYVTGGAAMEKWDHFIKKFARLDKDKRAIIDGRALGDFKKKLNLRSREPYVSGQIERLLSTGRADALEEAKAMWVKDVIADTQFLYGVADSPLISQTGGAITRTAVVFQSWWMNYGSLLEKWLTRTSDVGATANRMFTWMASSAIAYHFMLEPMWGKATARRTVAFGPLPVSADIPPSWRPFTDAVKLIIDAGSVPLGMQSMDKVQSRMKAMINSSLIYAPGGFQARQMYKGLKTGEPIEFAKSIFKFK